MGQASKIRTLRQVDDAVQQTASFRMNALDRALIDEEIRATQQHLVDSLINGLIATWSTLDSSSAAVVPGDTIAAAGSALGTVTKSTAGVLTAAGMGGGIVLAAASPGGAVRFATSGIILAATGITGLAVGAPGPVRINTTTGRLEQVSGFGDTDYPAGYVDAAGNLTIGLALPSFFSAGNGAIVPNPGATGNVTITASSGHYITGFKSLVASPTYKMPPAPTSGMICEALPEDTTFQTYPIIWDANGKQLTRNGVPAPTFSQDYANFGWGSCVFYFDGTIWRALS